MAENYTLDVGVNTGSAKGDVDAIRSSLISLGRAGDSVLANLDRRFSDLGRAVGKVDKLFESSSKSIELSSIRTALAVDEATEFVDQQARSVQRLGDVWVRESKTIGKATKSGISSLSRTSALASKRAQDLEISLQSVGKAARSSSSRISTLADENRDLANSLASVKKQSRGASKSLREGSRDLNAIGSAAGSALANFKGFVGGALTIAGAIQGIRKSIGIFGETQTGLIAVEKTTGLAAEEIVSLDEKISALSVGNIPLLKTELLDLAAVAGQVGASAPAAILAITETAARLQVASDLSGEDAVKTLVRIQNVNKEALEDIGRLGSVIVALGNNAAASESEIAKVASEVARSTAQFQLGSTFAAAYGTALVETGSQAELGGSVIGRTLREIQSGVIAGGETLEEFARIANVSADDFSSAFARSPVEALNLFLEGLGRFGQEASIELEKVGLKGEEVNKVLPTLAVNFDILAKRQAQANEEAAKGTALAEEANKAFSSQENQLKRVQNVARATGEAFGKGLNPSLEKLLESLSKVGADQNFQKLATAAGRALGVLADVVSFALDIVNLSAKISDNLSTEIKAIVDEGRELANVQSDVSEAIASADPTRISELTEKYGKRLDEVSVELGKAKKEALGYATALDDIKNGASTTEQETKALQKAYSAAKQESGKLENESRILTNAIVDLAMAQETAVSPTADVAGNMRSQSVASRDLLESLRAQIEVMSELTRSAGDAAARYEELSDLESLDQLAEGSNLVTQLELIEEAFQRGLGSLSEIEEAERRLLLIGLEREKLSQSQLDTLRQTAAEVEKSVERLPEDALVIDVKFEVDQESLSAIDEVIDNFTANLIAGPSQDQTFFDKLNSGFEDAGQAAKDTLGFALQDIFATALFDAENLDKAIQGAFAGVGQQFGQVLGTSLGGPLGGALGGALGEFLGNEVGKIFGGLFSSGGDDAVIRLRAVGGELDVLVEKIEGDLGPAIEAAGDQISRTIDRILGSLGGTLLSAEVGFKIREEEGEKVFRVFVDGLKREFEDQGEAIGFLIAQTLQKGLISGLSERVQTALQSSPAQSLEDVESAIRLATALDDAANNAGPLAQTIREIAGARTDEVRLARELNLSIQEAIELTDRRIGQLREEIQAQLESARGFSSSLRQIEALTQSVNDFNRGIDAERAARIQRIELLKQEEARLAEVAQAQTSVTDRGDAFATTLRGTDDEMDFISRTLGDLGQGASETGSGLAEVQEELAALEGSLGNLVDAIPAEELQAAIAAISGNLEASILRDLAQITGSQEAINRAASIERQLQLANLELRIAELNAIGLVSRAQLAFLNDLLDRAREAPAEVSGVGGRDRFAEAVQALSGPLDAARERAAAWSEQLGVLVRAQERGRISTERLAEIIQGLSDAVAAELFGAAASIAETVGLTEESAELSKQLAQAEFDLRVAELRILFEQAKALGLLSEEAQLAIEEVLGAAEGFQLVGDAAQTVQEAFDALSLPMDNVRQQAQDLKDTVEELNRLLADGLEVDVFEGAFAELAASVETGLLGTALEVLDVLGETEEAAALSKDLEQAKFDLTVAQLRLLFENARELGLLSDEAVERIDGILARAEGFQIPDAVPDIETPPGIDELISQFSSLGVSMASARAAAARYDDAIESLSLAQEAGVISSESAAEAMSQLAQAAFVDIGSQLVGFLDRYYGEAENNEELRIQLQEARFALEIAQLELQFQLVRDLGLLTEEQSALIKDALDFAKEAGPGEAGRAGADTETAAPGQVKDRVADLISQFSSLGVPIAAAIDSTRKYRDAISDLASAVEDGIVGIDIAAQSISDLGRSAFADLGSQVLGFVDRYYGQVGQNEELRIRLEETRFALELANLEIQFRMIQELGILTAEQIGMIEGALAFARANPPDFTGPTQAVESIRATSREVSDAADAVDDSLKRITERVREFIDGLGGASGRLASEAQRFVDEVQSLSTDLLDALRSRLGGANLGPGFASAGIEEIAEALFRSLGTFDNPFDLDAAEITGDRILELIQQLAEASGGGGLTQGQQEMLDALLEAVRLEEAAARDRQRRIDDILASFESPAIEGLAGKLEGIFRQFDDAREALEILGASAEELAQLDILKQEQIQSAIRDYIDGLKGATESIGNAFTDAVKDLDAALATAAAEGFDLGDFDREAGISAILDNILAPLESRSEDLNQQQEALLSQRDELIDAALALGAGASEIERIEAAFSSAIQELTAQAVDGLRGLLEEIQGDDPRVSPEQRFLESQERFRELAARAQAGDLEAISQLEDAARDFRQQSAEFLGVGVGSTARIDEITAAIEDVIGIAAESDPVVSELETGNSLLEQIRDSLTSGFGEMSIRPAGGDGASMQDLRPLLMSLRKGGALGVAASGLQDPTIAQYLAGQGSATKANEGDALSGLLRLVPQPVPQDSTGGLSQEERSAIAALVRQMANNAAKEDQRHAAEEARNRALTAAEMAQRGRIATATETTARNLEAMAADLRRNAPLAGGV